MGGSVAKKLQRLLLDALSMGDNLSIEYSIESRFNHLGTCKKHDMVLFRDGGVLRVAQIQVHCKVEGVPVSMVTMWNHIKHNAAQGWSDWLRSTGDAEFIATDHIVDTLIFCKLSPNSITVLMPLEHR